jgi:hypothetical protein
MAEVILNAIRASDNGSSMAPGRSSQIDAQGAAIQTGGVRFSRSASISAQGSDPAEAPRPLRIRPPTSAFRIDINAEPIAQNRHQDCNRLS